MKDWPQVLSFFNIMLNNKNVLRLNRRDEVDFTNFRNFGRHHLKPKWMISFLFELVRAIDPVSILTKIGCDPYISGVKYS